MPEIGLTKFNAGLSEDTSKNGGSSAFTASTGVTYVIAMGTGSPSTDLLVSLPVPAVGDSITFVLSSDDAVHGVDFDSLTAGTVTYVGTTPFRLSNTGDHVTFRYRGGSVGWLAY